MRDRPPLAYVFSNPLATIIIARVRRLLIALSVVVLSATCSAERDRDVVRSDDSEGSAAQEATAPSAGDTLPAFRDRAGGEGGSEAADGGAPGGSAPPGRVVVLGTSLTAGYGLPSQEWSYPAVLDRMVDSAGLPFEVVNAGVSGETSAGGLRRVGWILRQPVDVLVLELGANDGLRGQDVEALENNLRAIIDSTLARYPDASVVLTGMEAPPNMGDRYTGAFRSVYRRIAEDPRVTLVPFLLEGVAGVSELNQSDGIHPNREGHRRMAETVWPVLEPVLRRRSDRMGPDPAGEPSPKEGNP